jgi:hypothetical protein
MDNDKKLFEELLKADGINPAGITESERVVFKEMLDSQSKSKQPKPAARPNIWRIIMNTKTAKLAAAAIIIIAALLGVNSFLGTGTSSALADVVEQIYNATSVTYKQTYETDKYTFTNERMLIDGGYMRSVLQHGDIMVWDWSSGKHLHLMPGSKKAILTQQVGRQRGKRLFSHLDWVSKLHEKSGEFTGQEELDGQIVDVFVVEVPFEKNTVWVDPETNLPVQVKREYFPNSDENIIQPKISLSTLDFGEELQTHTNEDGQTVTTGGSTSTISRGSSRGSGKGIQERMTITMHDFEWNTEVDESLFSLEIPEGYTVKEQQMDVSEQGENGLIYSLSFWTEMSDGFFPSEINDLGDPDKIKPMLIRKFDKDGEPEEELDQAMKEAHRIIKGLYFAQDKKADGNWTYLGDGVQLGDAETLICWWESEDSETYRVIYGDLSAGDVAPEDLPE